ncbi:hypothetical protein [Thalassiella azotivora]
MRALRTATLLAGAGSLVAGTALLGAAPASASNICTIEVLSVTSRDLQDGDGQDEILLELGDDQYGVFTFTNNWTRNASLGRPRENFTGTVPYGLRERDWPTSREIDSSAAGCWAHTATVELEGAGALYELRYQVWE